MNGKSPPIFMVPMRTKAVTDETDGTSYLEGVASSTTTDRQGDTIAIEAINGMVAKAIGTTILLNHSHNLPEDAIGFITNAVVTKENGGAKFVIKAQIDPTSDRGMATFKQIKSGFSHGLSIGASLTDFEPNDPDDPFSGLQIKGLDLWEVSVVTVPANPDCYVRGLSGTIADQARAFMRGIQGPIAARKSAVTGKEPTRMHTTKKRAIKKDDANKADPNADSTNVDPEPTGTPDEKIGEISDTLMTAHETITSVAEQMDDADLSAQLVAAAETIDQETDSLDAVQEEVATQLEAAAKANAQVDDAQKRLDTLTKAIDILEKKKKDLEKIHGRRSIDTYDRDQDEDPQVATFERMATPRASLLSSLAAALAKGE